MKIKTDYVPESSQFYLTEGKLYQVTPHVGTDVIGYITDDQGDDITVHLGEGGCCHLEGDDWEVVQ